KRYPDRFAVMGRIPLEKPESAALLPKWKEQPGMLGVRVTFLGPAAAWLTDGTAGWFWPAAEKARLPVMFLSPGRASEFAHIAEHHPQLTLIVDHMGVKFGPRESRQVGGRDRADDVARQVSECVRQAVSSSQLFNRNLSVS